MKRETLFTLLDATSAIALLTALLFLLLYALLREPLLLLACIGYTLFGAWRLYVHQHRRVMAERAAQQTTQESLETTRIPQQSWIAMTDRMGVTVDGLVRASAAINDVTGRQVENATEQAEQISSANQRLDGFLELSESIHSQIRQVTESAGQASDISERGQKAIAQSLHSMEDIRTQVEVIGETITTLARLTRRIDEIITSVSEIATQSNLLALNASIEAARAGSQGRGFGVVAEEIRILADQSSEAAERVRDILRQIQSAMKDSVQATQQGIENVDVGVERTQEANAVIVQLADAVKESQRTVNDIQGIIRQQSDGMEEISILMDRVQQITQQGLASVRTIETVSANLSRLANDLQQTVSQVVPLPASP